MNGMQHRRLGRTNLEVSVIAIGTNQLRRVPERQAVETLKRAFELGVNLVNIEPDYEGADDILRTALRESDERDHILLSVQAGGDLSEFERIFETTCAKFGRECLDLFGVSSISEAEIYGANVWGAGGLVEFLQRKKEERRIRGIFASEHGSPEQMKTLLNRDVFDALMLAYNPLGFHLVTFRAETVYHLERPPAGLKGTYVREDLSRTRREILPLAKEKDVGVMLMKPLAGGLLCHSKAFPHHPWRNNLPQPPAARDVLRYLLADNAVACVIPGMASIEEVAENAEAGYGNINLTTEQAAMVESRSAALSRVLCSRCGHCDDLCSRGLPLSFIFRAAYHYLYPTAPFGISSTLQYFRLHPWDQCACETCLTQACRCPSGIDIPGELALIHRKMLELRDRGVVPTADRDSSDWVTGRLYSIKVLSCEIPTSLSPGQQATVRLHLRNRGTRTWYKDTADGHSGVTLRVSLDSRCIKTVRLRKDVFPQADCHFAFTVETPSLPGMHLLRMELFDEEEGLISDEDVPAIRTMLFIAHNAQISCGQREAAEQVLEQERQRLFIFQNELHDSEVTRSRLIEVFRQSCEQLKHQCIQAVHQSDHKADVHLNEIIQSLALRNNDLEDKVRRLSTGKAAARQIVKSVLYRLGLFDFVIRHYPIFDSIDKFLFRHTKSLYPATAPEANSDQMSVGQRTAHAGPEVNQEDVRFSPQEHEQTQGTAGDLFQNERTAPERTPVVSTTATLAARYVEHNVPPECIAGSLCAFRVLVENSGSDPWYSNPSDGHFIGLCLFIDGNFEGSGKPIQAVVEPGERAMIAVTTKVPRVSGTYCFRFDLMVHNRAWFSQTGTLPLELTVRLTEGIQSRTDELLEISSQRNSWFFSPSQSVHHSRGVHAYPIFGESTKGCTLTDVEGRKFLDVHMGWGTHLLGYSDERIQKALANSLATSSGVISLPHRLEIEVSEMLCDRFPFGDEVLFGKNGSDVTTWAVRTARIATGRKTVLCAGYHGWQDWYVASQGFTATGVPSDNNRYNILLPYRDLTALEQAVSVYFADIAAIMIEPAATNIDIDDPHHEKDGPYLKRAEELARKCGALFVLDEIMTGFRFRSGSAQGAYGLTPDLTCLGKALANGMPLSALVGRKDLLKKNIAQIYYAPTMKGEVYSYAAALKALQIYHEEDIPRIVWDVGDRIRSEVNKICKDIGLHAALIGAPYRMYFNFFELSEERDVFCRTLLQQELTRNGIISNKGYVILSSSHNQDAVDKCVSGFGAALKTIRAALESDSPTQFVDIPDVIMERRAVSRISEN